MAVLQGMYRFRYIPFCYNDVPQKMNPKREAKAMKEQKIMKFKKAGKRRCVIHRVTAKNFE